MRSIPHTIAAIVLGLTAASCADAPTAPRATDATPLFGRGDANKSEKAAQRAALLTDVPVTGALSDGGSFIGTFTAKRLDVDPVTRQLSMTGVLAGTATELDGTITEIAAQPFTTPIELRSASTPSVTAIPASFGAPAQPGCAQTAGYARQVQLASCDVLFLDLGPLHLDLLGLTVDLSQVVLDINAVTGPGNLLGNLLCALLGLLDGAALLTAVTQLLTLVNNILAGLGGAGVGGASLADPSILDAAATLLPIA